MDFLSSGLGLKTLTYAQHVESLTCAQLVETLTCNQPVDLCEAFLLSWDLRLRLGLGFKFWNILYSTHSSFFFLLSQFNIYFEGVNFFAFALSRCLWKRKRRMQCTRLQCRPDLQAQRSHLRRTRKLMTFTSSSSEKVVGPWSLLCIIICKLLPF